MSEITSADNGRNTAIDTIPLIQSSCDALKLDRPLNTAPANFIPFYAYASLLSLAQIVACRSRRNAFEVSPVGGLSHAE